MGKHLDYFFAVKPIFLNFATLCRQRRRHNKKGCNDHDNTAGAEPPRGLRTLCHAA